MESGSSSTRFLDTLAAGEVSDQRLLEQIRYLRDMDWGTATVANNVEGFKQLCEVLEQRRVEFQVGGMRHTDKCHDAARLGCRLHEGFEVMRKLAPQVHSICCHSPC